MNPRTDNRKTLLASLCFALLASAASAAGFFQDKKASFSPGKEFPGATGSFSVVGDELKLRYDFSKGGHYVAAQFGLPEGPAVNAVEFDVSHDVDVRLGLRLVDMTGQVFQRSFGILASEWEHRVCKVSADGWNVWGGLGDKVIHPPFTRIDFLADNATPGQMGGSVGEIRVKNVKLLSQDVAEAPKAFPLPLADVSFADAIRRAGSARDRLERSVPLLEKKGLGAKGRASLTVLDTFFPWVLEDVARGQTNRAVREAREMAYLGERAATCADEALAGKRPDFPVPHYRTSKIEISRAQAIADRVWPDGKVERGPVFFNGYGHFSKVCREMHKLPKMGCDFIQMEFGPWDFFPSEKSVTPTGADWYLKVVDQAAKDDVSICLLISPHYFPDWAKKKWKELGRCGCERGYCPYDPATREFFRKYLRLVIPIVKDKKALHSICMANEPSIGRFGTCPYVREEWPKWYARRHNGAKAPPVPAGSANNAYSPDLAEFVRFNRELFAAWYAWWADEIRALAPDVPLHVKIQADNLNWAESNPVFYSIDPVAFGRFSDYNGNDALDFECDDASSVWYHNWWHMEAGYDLQRAACDKPVVNTENHFHRDRSHDFYYPGQHTYAALWQNALHGQNASAFWCWERVYDGGQDTFNGLVLERPEAMEGYAHCALDLQRLADKLVPLQNADPAVLVLWSTEFFLDGGASAFSRCYRAASLLGRQVGVVSEEMVEAYGQAEKAVRPFDKARVLLLPVTKNARLPKSLKAGVDRFAQAGGKVVRVESTPERDLHAQFAAKCAEWELPDVPFAADPKTGLPVFGVESRGYRADGCAYVSLCNHTKQPIPVRLEAEGTDLITGEKTGRDVVARPLVPLFVEMKPAK